MVDCFTASFLGMSQLFPGDFVNIKGKRYKIINIGKGHMIGKIKLRRYLVHYLWIPNEDILKRWKR